MRFAYDPTEYFIYFNDFMEYTAGDWTITTTEAGAGSATEAATLTAGTNGVLVITNDAADNDADFFTSVNEVVQYVAGKRLHFKARFKIGVVLLTGAVMGLAITDTTPEAVTDGIYFRMAETGILSLVVCKNSTESTVEVATLVADTYVVAEFVYDGSNEKIVAYIDGAPAGSVALTNVPDDEALAVTFGVRNGEAVARVMTIDYIMVAKER
jgi:hypothetical protein